MPLVTKDEMNHTDPIILIPKQETAKKIEDRPLPCYLVNVVVNPDTGEIFEYKDIMQ